MKILIIEDELAIAEVEKAYIEREGYEAEIAQDGLDGLAKFRADSFDLVLLDLMLPGMAGTDVCREIRRSSNAPILMVTAKSGEDDIVAGLDAGADDYIVKPFEMLEVMVRLEKVLELNGTVQEQIQIGDVIIDTSSRTVTKMGMEIYLKPMEYNCLMVFAKNPNKALTRNQILQELWNEEFCKNCGCTCGSYQEKTWLAG